MIDSFKSVKFNFATLNALFNSTFVLFFTFLKCFCNKYERYSSNFLQERVGTHKLIHLRVSVEIFSFHELSSSILTSYRLKRGKARSKNPTSIETIGRFERSWDWISRKKPAYINLLVQLKPHGTHLDRAFLSLIVLAGYAIFAGIIFGRCTAYKFRAAVGADMNISGIGTRACEIRTEIPTECGNFSNFLAGMANRSWNAILNSSRNITRVRRDSRELSSRWYVLIADSCRSQNGNATQREEGVVTSISRSLCSPEFHGPTAKLRKIPSILSDNACVIRRESDCEEIISLSNFSQINVAIGRSCFLQRFPKLVLISFIKRSFKYLIVLYFFHMYVCCFMSVL